MEDQIREILDAAAHLAVPARGLERDADLFAAGLSSLATVHVMLAVEQAFDVEFPDALLTRRTFQNIASLADVVARLQAGKAAA